MRQYLFTKQKTVELVERELFPGPEQVGGKTLVSLISAGTEINGPYWNTQGWEYPLSCGYSAVFQIDYVCENAQGLKKGDLAFCCGNHADYQLHDGKEVIKLPEGMEPETALFARMAGISMATLSRTNIHPGDKVLVVGLGAVGLLALQAYSACGYRVAGVEPSPERAAFARQLTGLTVYEQLPEEENGKSGLALECSGTQQAAMTCCLGLRQGGEMSLVGVPWKPTGDIQSYQLLNRIFYQYLTVYSGWEMNLPLCPAPFAPDSQKGNFSLALKWLKEGRLRTHGMWAAYPYQQAQQVYDAIAEKREPHISVIFDWRKDI